MQVQTRDGKPTSAYAIGFLNKETNRTSYYTGKGGDERLSPNPEDALFGYSLSSVHFVGRKMQEAHHSLAELELVPVIRP